MAGRGAIEDPLKNFRFRVTCEKFNGAVGFMECSKVEQEVEEIAYREGGDQETVRKSPGLSKYTDVTLKRGQFAAANAGASDFYSWIKEVAVWDAGGSTEGFRASTLTITQYSNTNQPVKAWTLRNVWPKKFSGTDLKGDANENCIEELVLCHEGFYMENL